MKNKVLTPKKLQDIEWKKIGEETIILGRKSQSILRLNSIGSFIWFKINGKRNLKQVTKQIVLHYKVNEKKAEKDLHAFLQELKKLKLIHFE